MKKPARRRALEIFLTLFLKPILLVLLFLLVLYPTRLAVIRFWPDGKVKRFLLR
jgi:hypothetical protein